MHPSQMAVLEHRLSAERLGPYQAACDSDLSAALGLYLWNAEVSAALGTTIGHVEVLLRNAMHDHLTTWTLRKYAEPRWYLNPGGFLFAEALADVATARTRATRNGQIETPGRIVAELSLGFWRFLLARRYDRGLWHSCLHQVFPGQRRATAFDAISALHEARNRVAHHEPMFNRDVKALFDTSLAVASWICPVSHGWIGDNSRVRTVMSQRPS